MHTAYPPCDEPSNSHGMYAQSLTARTTESIISFLLRKNVERKRSHHQNHFPQQQFYPMTSPSNPYYVECKTSPLCEDGKNTQVITSPLSPSWDRSCLENHRAKRARVENILQRMAGSPPMQVTDEKAVSHLTRYQAWNHSKDMLLPLLEYCHSKGKSSCGEDCRTGESPEHLNVLHAGHQKDQMSQVYQKNSEEEEYLGGETALQGVAENGEGTPVTSHTLQSQDSLVVSNSRDHMQHCLNSEWERNKTQSSHTGLDKDELMDLLKSELSRAVNLSVDLVFRKMSHSLHKTAAQDPGEESEHHLSEENVKFEERTAPSYNLCSEKTEPSLPNVQTEALSLVIQKPSNQENSNTLTQVNTSVSETKNPLFESKHRLNTDQEVLQRLQESSPNVFESLSCRYNASQSSVDLLSHSWEPIKVTSKGMSSCMNQQAQLVALSQLAFDNLSLPHIKRENQGIVESNSLLPFHISFESAVAS